MKVTKDIEEKIEELQILERNLQNTLLQKQTFQTQLLEIKNALEELEKSKKETYKIIGTIMIASDASELKKDLKSKKEIIDLRVKNLEKQEEQIREKASKMQLEVMNALKEKRG